MDLSLLDIKSDYIFKQVFGAEKNKRVLISFLNAILAGRPKVVDVELQNTDIAKIVKEGKSVRLDVKAKISESEFVDIEIQCRDTYDIPERAIQYLASMLVENSKSSRNVIESNYAYPKVVGIWILARNVTDRAAGISRAYMTFQKDECDEYEIMTDKARIIFIELQKFKPKKLDRRHMLDVWISFLQNPDNEEARKIDANVEQAFDTLRYVSADPDVREIYRLREETQMGIISEKNASMRFAEAKGRAEGEKVGEARGFERGAHEKAIETAKNLLKAGVNIEVISAAVGISLEEIKKLRR